MSLDLSKLKVDYPSNWEYKVITESKNKIEDILFDTVNRKYKIVKQNNSKSGKYTSYTITMDVESKEDKDAILTRIYEHAKVYMVL